MGKVKEERDKQINRRMYEEALYIIETNATIREVADRFKVSKSTVHTDMNKRLREEDGMLYNEVQKVFEIHTQERAKRGGEATSLVWMNKRRTESYKKYDKEKRVNYII